MSLGVLSKFEFLDHQQAMVLSGGCGGFVQGVVMSPALLLKTRVMTDARFRSSGGVLQVSFVVVCRRSRCSRCCALLVVSATAAATASAMLVLLLLLLLLLVVLVLRQLLLCIGWLAPDTCAPPLLAATWPAWQRGGAQVPLGHPVASGCLPCCNAVVTACHPHSRSAPPLRPILLLSLMRRPPSPPPSWEARSSAMKAWR